jgi:holliday junction DNA helicase RuvB
MPDPIHASSASPDDVQFENELRPRQFAEFVGQRKLVENLKLYIRAAKERSEPLDHVLLTGAPGLGKTTLAGIIAQEMAFGIKSTSGPAITKPFDLMGVLSGLADGEILFIDEIHRLPVAVSEYLFAAMEDFVVDLKIDEGPAARVIKYPLKRFTLVAATTREGLMPAPFRSRFLIQEKIEPYPPDELAEIVERAAVKLNVPIEPPAARLIAERGRGTPRYVLRYLRRIRDEAQVHHGGKISLAAAEKGLERQGVDSAGLNNTDRQILRTLLQHGGGPVGVKTLAVAAGEEDDTIEDVYEPFLIREGFLNKTPRGRVAGPRAWEHLGVTRPKKSGQSTDDLF